MVRSPLPEILILVAAMTTRVAASEGDWMPVPLAQANGDAAATLALCRETPPSQKLPNAQTPRDPWAPTRPSDLYDGVQLRLIHARDCNASDSSILWHGRVDELDLGHQRLWFEAALTLDSTAVTAFVVILQHKPCTQDLRVYRVDASRHRESTAFPALPIDDFCDSRLASATVTGRVVFVTLSGSANDDVRTYSLDTEKAEWSVGKQQTCERSSSKAD